MVASYNKSADATDEQKVVEIPDDLIKTLGLTKFDFVSKKHNHVVLETPDYFYKITEIDKDDPTTSFDLILKHAFEEEYQKIGLDWKCSEVCASGISFFVERRQKLRPLNRSDCSYEKAIRNDSIFTRRVEAKLGFAQLSAQVKQKFGVETVDRVCIARDCKVDYDDFVVFGEYIISLSNSQYVLALINPFGKWIFGVASDAFRVKMRGVEFVFGPYECLTEEIKLALNFIESNVKWWLFSKEQGEEILLKRKRIEKVYKEMNRTNIEILCTKKPLPSTATTFSLEEEIALFS